MAKLDLTGVLKDSAGTSYNFSGTLDSFVAEPAPVVTSPVVETVQPAIDPLPVSSIPLLWDDARFARNTAALSSRVVNGGTIANKTITDTGNAASIVTGNGATIQNCRIKSREGIRIGGGGNFLIDGCYIEVNGTGNDHADGVQAYAPGSKGVIKVRNTLIKCGLESATAGFFVADNWTGVTDFENVVFEGGPFGLRLHADSGGDINVSLANVYFIERFMYKPFYFLNYGGKKVVIQKWENVRWATIENGKLIPGEEMQRP